MSSSMIATRLVLIILSLSYFVENFCKYLYSVATIPFLSTSSYEYSLLSGLFFSLFYTSFGLLLVFVNDAGDWNGTHKPTRKLLLLSVASFIYSLVFGLTPLTTQFYELAMIRMVMGVCQSVVSPFSIYLISLCFEDNRKGFAFSIYQLGVYFAYSSSMSLGSYMYYKYGWLITYFIASAVGVTISFFVPCIYFFLPSTTNSINKDVAPSPVFSDSSRECTQSNNNSFRMMVLKKLNYETVHLNDCNSISPLQEYASDATNEVSHEHTNKKILSNFNNEYTSSTSEVIPSRHLALEDIDGDGLCQEDIDEGNQQRLQSSTSMSIHSFNPLLSRTSSSSIVYNILRTRDHINKATTTTNTTSCSSQSENQLRNICYSVFTQVHIKFISLFGFWHRHALLYLVAVAMGVRLGAGAVWGAYTSVYFSELWIHQQKTCRFSYSANTQTSSLYMCPTPEYPYCTSVDDIGSSNRFSGTTFWNSTTSTQFYCSALNELPWHNIGMSHSIFEAYISWVPLLGSALGSVVGALVSDFLAMKYGIQIRPLLVCIGNITALPFVVLSLLVPSPWCFLSMIVSGFFGELYLSQSLALITRLVNRYCSQINCSVEDRNSNCADIWTSETNSTGHHKIHSNILSPTHESLNVGLGSDSITSGSVAFFILISTTISSLILLLIPAISNLFKNNLSDINLSVYVAATPSTSIFNEDVVSLQPRELTIPNGGSLSLQYSVIVTFGLTYFSSAMLYLLLYSKLK